MKLKGRSRGIGAGRGWLALAGVFMGGALLLPLGCGEYSSWNERWLFDDHDGHSSSPNEVPAAPVPAAPVPACGGAPIDGYGYAEPPEFWLGTRSVFELRVDGPGYLMAGTAGADASELRFLRNTGLSVTPDGSIELAGEPALGYPLDAVVGGPCLGELRAPSIAAPRATSSINILMNLDPRTPVVHFDVLDASATANTSLSLSVFDNVGQARTVDIYFSNAGNGLHNYYVLVDGADLVGGTPGTPVWVGRGSLQFDANGALSVASTPPFDIAFAGAGPGQDIYLSFGPDIASGGNGSGSSTAFASYDEVFALSADGVAVGTGSGIDVLPNGEVLVYYDNGEVLPIGTLALARFPEEPELAPLADGWATTAESGPPQLGQPQSPGRGAVIIESVSPWP
jgi:flagellar hook-basal body protein